MMMHKHDCPTCGAVDLYCNCEAPEEPESECVDCSWRRANGRAPRPWDVAAFRKARRENETEV